MIPMTVRRVVIAQHRIDFRKQITGLLAESYRLGADPYQGDCVVFIKRDQTQLRALCGDPLGIFMLSRRFDGGPIRWLNAFASTPTVQAVTTAELSLLFEGATFTIHKRAGPCNLGMNPMASSAGR